jgi:cobalt-zinc-cadmium efflux system outer membrane protein
MKPLFWNLPPLLILLLCVPPLARANSTADTTTNRLDPLSLAHAIALAEHHHPALAEAIAQIEAADARAEQAGRFPNPDAIARIEQAPFSGRVTGEAEYLAGITQPVPLGPRRAKARDMHHLERERQSAELEARRRELHRHVHNAFATALYQQHAFESQTTIAGSAEKAAAIAGARARAGDAAPEDVARARIESARMLVELNRSAALRDQALTGLAAAIGDPGLSIRSLQGELETTFAIPRLESLVADVASNPEALAAGAAVRVEAARVNLAKAQRVPDVRVEVLYRRLQAEETDAFDLGLSLPLPLFDRNQGRLREARAELQATEARARATRNELDFRLREAHAQLRSALATSRALKSEVLPHADTLLRAAEARLAGGDATLGDILPVRRDWAAVRLSYLESLRDAMQAWAALRALIGAED